MNYFEKLSKPLDKSGARMYNNRTSDYLMKGTEQSH